MLGVNDYEHVEIEPSGEVATTFENEQWQSRVELTHNPIAGFTGAVGLQLDDRDFSAVGEEAFITPTETEAWALFLLEEYTADWATLQFGLRIESLEHTNADFADYDDEAVSFAGGISLPFYADNNLIFNVSRTERNPNAEELYSNGAHIATRQFEIGLLADGMSADKEVAWNYDLGIENTTGDVVWDAWIYYYHYADYVYQDLTGAVEDGLPEAIYRQDGADFLGAEASVTFPVWDGGSMDNALRLFGDYVEAELDGGEKLPRIPPWRLGANFTFGPESWQGGLDVIYHAEQDDISSFNTDDYTMVNASFLYRLDAQNSEWELFVRGNNLLDEDARRSTSFIAAFAPLPGISFSAGVRGRF